MALLLEHNGKRPQIAADVFLAPNATLIGDVVLEAGASVWYGAVLRGDSGRILVGERTNIQDNVVLHCNRRHNTVLAADVVVGHGVVAEGCTVGSYTVLGMNATILDGSNIGSHVIVAAGSLVREGMTIPDGVLVAGVPAVVKGTLSEHQRARAERGPSNYVKLAQSHQNLQQISNAQHE